MVGSRNSTNKHQIKTSIFFQKFANLYIFNINDQMGRMSMWILKNKKINLLTSLNSVNALADLPPTQHKDNCLFDCGYFIVWFLISDFILSLLLHQKATHHPWLQKFSSQEVQQLMMVCRMGTPMIAWLPTVAFRKTLPTSRKNEFTTSALLGRSFTSFLDAWYFNECTYRGNTYYCIKTLYVEWWFYVQ